MVFFAIPIFLLVGCGDNNENSTDDKNAITVETVETIGITDSKAIARGKISGDRTNVSNYGIELYRGNDETPLATYHENTKLAVDEFSINLSGLTNETVYRFRAFADNGVTCYGDTLDVTTLPPTITQDFVQLADPYIFLYKGIYYAYGTRETDVKSGFSTFISNDLTSWHRLPELALNKADSYGELEFWAPEVYHRKSNGKFYMFYSAERHICAAVGDSPEGPFKQAIQSPMRANSGIDNTLFIDDNDKAYAYFVLFDNGSGKNTGNCIWCAELNDDWLTIKEETKKLCIDDSYAWEGNVIEGPNVFKHNGVYYCMYSSQNYQQPTYAVSYATASSPIGPWTKVAENPILQKPTADLVGTGHGAPFRDKAGNWRYVFHAHCNTTTVQPRKMYIADMTIGEDGKISLSKNNIIYTNEY